MKRLFRPGPPGGGPPLRLGRLRDFCAREGLRLPGRFKRLPAEGVAHYRAAEGRLALWPAEAVEGFECAFLA